MYYVCYKDKTNTEHRVGTRTVEEAITLYESIIPYAIYGYISDDEAIDYAEHVKDKYEDYLRSRRLQAEARARMYRRYNEPTVYTDTDTMLRTILAEMT